MKHTQLAEKIVSRQIGAASPAVSPDGKLLAHEDNAQDFPAKYKRKYLSKLSAIVM